MSGQPLLMLIISATGLLIMSIGWYIHKAKAYHLIAGFNSLSSQEKDSLNMDKFIRNFRNVFFLMGFLIIISYPVSSLLGYERYTSLAAVLVVISGAIFLNYRIRVFFKKTKKKS